MTEEQLNEETTTLGQKLDSDAAANTWLTWRSLLLAAMGEPLQPDELD